MAKTIVQKVGSPVPDVFVFKISGTLGFHENKVLARFFEECSSRAVRNLVLDLSELDSLGGGCAKIIRDAAKNGKMRVSIAGASRTVRNFLGSESSPVTFASDVETALEAFRADGAGATGGLGAQMDCGRGPNDAGEPVHEASGREDARAGDVLAEVEDILEGRPSERPFEASPAVCPPPTEARCAVEELGPVPPTSEPTPTERSDGGVAEVKDLKRQIVRYRALLSLSKELSRIEDKSALLDSLLLSIVAQVGVEAAALLELSGDTFVAACWKGFETADPASLGVRRDDVEVDTWLRSPRAFSVEESPMREEARKRIQAWDFRFAAPFVAHDELRGIVLLGKPIRRRLDLETWEFLSMMFDQAAVAYENSCRREKESERMLGLAHSLVSMIENNTVSRGTTEMVVNLAYTVAVKMHYPEENLRDLLYGAILRDIGMLSTGTYIAKSPRELVPEEWEIIKKHPVEGAAILARMGFSEHTCRIVRWHHERYNGEGYPDGLAGSHIPLGARIVSVVESYAAMIHDRPTRPALAPEEALNTLEENWGLRYDPEVVKVFRRALEEEAAGERRNVRRGFDLIKG